jgi:hypothetical protein
MHIELARWPRRILGVAFLLAVAGVNAQALTVEWSNDPEMQTWATTYDLLYGTDWQNGISPQIGVQANPGDISVVDDPIVSGKKAIRASISIAEDFSHVANGSPRAELSFPAPIRFAQGPDYLIQWSTFLPTNFAFDSKQPMIITQIHQGPASGTPPIALVLMGNDYEISERGVEYPGNISVANGMCCASADRGKWVHWTLRYVSDDSGQHALIELYKNGTSVYAARGVANAYPNDQNAYLKIGLYKPDWILQPSDVTQSTIFYGPVYVSQR